MSHQTDQSLQNTTFLAFPEFDNLETFRACAIRYRYARHFHGSYSIGVIEAGVGGNRYRGQTYLAPPNSVVFMNPQEVHTGYSAADQPLTYRMLYPSVELVQQVAQDLRDDVSPFFRHAFVQDPDLACRLLALHDALEQSAGPLEQQSLLVDALSAALLHHAEARRMAHRPAFEPEAVRCIKAYLHDCFEADVSLDDLAEITQLNRFYLIRVFRQAVGMPPYAYLKQIRVEQAKQLLRQGMAIADVATAVGFSDQSHLTRHFKQIFGITPGQYRHMSTSFKTD